MAQTRIQLPDFEIHVIKSKLGYIAFHPPSFVAFRVDGKTGRVLQNYEEGYSPSQISRENKLTTQECYQIIQNFYEIAIKNRNLRQQTPFDKILQLCLIVSTDCNMRCSYCYAEQGSYGMKRELMTKKTAKKAIDVLLTRHPEIIQIKFFGGEPLLNFKVIAWICKYIRDHLGKTIRYTIDTNGTIFNKKIRIF